MIVDTAYNAEAMLKTLAETRLRLRTLPDALDIPTMPTASKRF